MLTLILLAQLAQLSGPRCGWLSPGVEITPWTSNIGGMGCVVPGPTPEGTRLIPDPFTPGGIRAKPAGPSVPNQIQYLP